MYLQLFFKKYNMKFYKLHIKTTVEVFIQLMQSIPITFKK
jgi:hypothetical protein